MYVLKQLFARTYPQLYGIFFAGVALWFARMVGERAIGTRLSLEILVIPVNLLVLAAAVFVTHRSVNYTAHHLDQHESPWHIIFFSIPFIAVFFYILLYIPNII